MAITVVQAANNRQAASNVVTVTLTATSANNALIAFSRQGANNTNTVTMSDSSGSGTWVNLGIGYVSGDDSTNRHACWYKLNSASVTTVTCTWTAGSQPTDMVCYEIAGASTTLGEDMSVKSFTSAATSLATNLLTTANPNTILIACCGAGADQTWGTVPSGFTFPTGGSTVRCYVAYKVVSAAQSNTTCTITDNVSASMATLFFALQADLVPTARPMIRGS